MQFQIPQFETENKILGPFNIVQFAVLAVAIVISILLFAVLEAWLWVMISSILVGSSLAFALAKVNGRSMIFFVPAAFNYLWSPKTLALKPRAAVTGIKHIEPLRTLKKFEVPTTVTPTIPAKLIPEKRKGSMLQDLFNKITTTSSPIPQREESLKQASGSKWQDKYEFIQKPTGETIIARRVDYR
jgi:hypothetical protein